ncbi:acetylcholinesterase-like [Saccostrea echinata]|uniref:acetylcholinesterase-like n=1 Tax=Saccostrea echinata TaxID=191078 RepID=UPI002A7F3B78|nr:acetylcholinesterase-like [Saccostrea echinata]
MGILFISCVILSVIDIAECSYSYSVRVNTQHGPVEGFAIPSQYAARYRKHINIFLGIPYAKRPIEYNNDPKLYRFKKPERPYWEGVWEAKSYKPACPQHLWYVRETVPNMGSANISEDCLYMNIFAPSKTEEIPSNSPTLYPVMVFIHGGGYTMGASQEYPGVFLAERDVVVVTFNYRLGPLGFLCTNDANSPGNYGMWDQVRALEFVKENIRNFRGNPGIITIFGQNTGASSVGLQILSPRSVNLFHRAIMQSGSDRSEWAIIKTNNDAQYYAQELARELGCPTGDMFRLTQCLREHRSYGEIVNASSKVRLRPGSVGNPWGPVVDGSLVGTVSAFLPDHPKQMRELYNFKPIEVMGGLNKDDGSFFIPNLPTLDEGIQKIQFDNIINEFLSDRGVQDSVTRDAMIYQYTYWPQPKNQTMILHKTIDMMSDYMFGTGMNEAMRFQTGKNKTFFYVFNYFSWNDYLPYYRGVAHGQELQYIFGFPFINQTYTNLLGLYPRQQYDYADRNMSEYMMSLWTNFSSYGDPTPRRFSMINFKNVTWGQHNIYNHSYFYISNSSYNYTNFRQKDYGFWSTYFPQLASRPQTIVTTAPLKDTSENFQVSTWSLTALSSLLVIIIIALCIVNYRNRPKDY